MLPVAAEADPRKAGNGPSFDTLKEQMRLQLPNKVSMTGVLVYAVGIFLVQQFQHTSLLFSEFYFVYVVCLAISFNLAHGFESVPGAYLFSYGILVAALGVTWKAVLGQAADSFLQAPRLTMAAHALGAFLSIPVVWLVMRFDLRPYSIAALTQTENPSYERISLGCLIVGIIMEIASNTLPGGSGSLIGFLNHFQFFLPLAVVLGTVGVIRRTDGQRTMTATTAAALLVSFILGFLTFSKQGMISPFAAWLIAAAYSRLRLRSIHFAAILAGFLLTMFFIPMWAGAREDVPEGGLNLSERVELSIQELSHLSELEQREDSTADFYRDLGLTGYFGTDMGFMDRLQMLGPDDRLISFSAEGNYEGAAVALLVFQDWMPHFLVPNKVQYPSGNTYSHEMGTLSPDDFTTGISFSPVGEAFHLSGWYGVLFLLPAVWILTFFVNTVVVGNMVKYPWGLLSILFFAHAAPESGVLGMIDFTWFFNVALIGCIFFCNRISPVIGSLLARKRLNANASALPPFPTRLSHPG